MKTLPLLAITLLALGGCVTANTPGAPVSASAQNAPGQILYGADTVVECKYHSGCRTIGL